MAQNYAIVDDDVFKQFAMQAEQEAQLGNNNFGGSFQKDYEEIKWTGLEKNVWSVLRAVSGFPNSHLDSSTARSVIISKIVDDNGKQMKVVRPSYTADPNYILTRIIAAVTKPVYVNNGTEKPIKKFPVQEQHPEIYNQIEKNGLNPADKRYMYDKGWKGSEVLIMNVIDRKQMDWHREHKHTMLLAKSISNVNGREFVDEGISWFASHDKLRHYLTSYGSWEKYDLGIKRTGQKSDAYIITNVTQSPLEVDEETRQYISSTPNLTEEELSWERYDLDKLFRVTTATKIYNRLKNTIKRIDEALGTTFYAELLKEVEAEKKTFAEIYNKNSVEETPAVNMTVSDPSATISVIAGNVAQNIPDPASTPARTRERVVTSRAIEPWQELPFGEALPEYRRKQIVGLIKDETGKIINIKWSDEIPNDKLYSCPNAACGALAPETDVPRCPLCGYDFSAYIN